METPSKFEAWGSYTLLDQLADSVGGCKKKCWIFQGKVVAYLPGPGVPKVHLLGGIAGDRCGYSPSEALQGCPRSLKNMI